MIFGGYTALSTLFGKLVDYVGCVWGLWGIIGCWQMKEEYIKIYNYYNMFRLATWGFILYQDFPLLWNCEEWALDLDGAEKDMDGTQLCMQLVPVGSAFPLVSTSMSLYRQALCFFCT